VALVNEDKYFDKFG